MRLVHLTTEFPWPPLGGGPVRTLAQLRLLAALPEVEAVTLVSVAERPVAAAAGRALAAAVPGLRVVPPVFHPVHLRRHPRFVPRTVALRLRGVPYLAAKWDSPALRRTLRRALAEAGPDAVWVDHLGMAGYLPEIRAARPAARVILDQHNVESALFERYAAGRRGWVRWLARAEARAAARFERRMLQAVDAVVAVSTADADRFRQLAGVTAHVVPVVAEPGRRSRPRPAGCHFCYVGSLGWHPNAAGLDWLCQRVWPRVRARLPEATLEIAGVGLPGDRSGRPVVPAAWRVPGVATVGFLEDLEPLFARSLAMLAPVVGGAGVRIKILQAFQAGLPVVTTPDGAAGLPLTDGTEALIAGEPDAFAERVARLAHSEALRTRLAAAAATYLERGHAAGAARPAVRAALGLGPA